MTDLEQAARKLVQAMGPQQVAALLAREHNRHLAEQEAVKEHPLVGFALPEAGWRAMRDHVMDGGGVVDDGPLGRELLQALLDDDQAAFWPALVHLLKAWLKIRGHVETLPGGAVKFNGVASTPKKGGE